MKKNIILAFILLCFFMPLSFVLFNIVIGLSEDIGVLGYFFKDQFFHKIINSLWLSFSVALFSIFIGLGISLGFFALASLWQKVVFILLLFLLFSISPIIYLVALSKLQWFNALEAFVQAVYALSMNFFPLAAMLFIFSFSKLEASSIQTALRISSIKYVLKFIVFPQMYRPAGTLFLLIFMLSFIHEEVPSFLGYRTYAEEFLSRIVAMENLHEISFITLPFIFIAIVVLIFVNKLIHKEGFQRAYQAKPYACSKYSIFAKLILVVLGLLVVFLVSILIKELRVEEISILINENTKAITNSIVLALLTGVIGSYFSWVIYPFISRVRLKFLSSFIVLGMLLYWLIPSSLNSLSLVPVSLYLSEYGTFFEYSVLLLAYLIKVIPIGVLIIASSHFLNAKDVFLDLNRLNKVGLIQYIQFPLHWSKYLFLSTVLSVFSFNELSSTVLLIPPGEETIIVRMYNLMHYGDFSSVAFLSLFQVLIIMIAVSVLGYSIKRQYDYT